MGSGALQAGADVTAFTPTPSLATSGRAADGGESRPVWRHKFHSLRHCYASYALAPLEAGGLGWSLSFVQKSLAHT
jgi:hypothetical protein